VERQIPEDEIDLGAFGRKASRLAFYPFRLFARNIITTCVFIVAAVLLAITFKFILPKTYSSSFIIRPSDKTEKFHLKILGDLQFLLKNQDHHTVSSLLGVEEKVTRSLLKLDLNNPFVRNRSDSVNYTEVTITTNDNRNFLPLQRSIIAYLENTPYFRKIHDLQRKQVSTESMQVDRDLSQLDSLKKLQLAGYHRAGIERTGTLLLQDAVNPVSIYSMGVDRLNKKTALMAQEVFLDNFQVVKSCVPVQRHTSPPRILVMCLYLVPLFLFLCFIFLAVRERARAKITS
jgi:hypothetical protein